MRVNRYIRNRKSPAFVGKSIYLDGVSDYLDLQGRVSPAWWRRSYSYPRDTTGPQMNRSMTWSFWVKFPSTEINKVIQDSGGTYGGSNTGFSGAQMSHFILAQNDAEEGSASTPQWGGYYIGLVSNDDNKVYVAAGYGVYNVSNVGGRCLRRAYTTEIVADTWYHIVVGFTGRDTLNGTDIGTRFWINGAAQSYAVHYPVNISSGEFDGHGGHGRHWEDYYHDTFIGRKGSQYTEMYISEIAFWEGVLLDTNDVGTLYGSGTPLADVTSNSSNYDKGSISGHKYSFTFTDGLSSPSGQQITITDYDGNAVTYLLGNFPSSNGFIDGTTGFTCVHTAGYNTLNRATNFIDAVNHDNGHGYGDWALQGTAPTQPTTNRGGYAGIFAYMDNTNLLTNGDFTATTDWTIGSNEYGNADTWTISTINKKATLASVTTENHDIRQLITGATGGTVYKVQFTVSDYNIASGKLKVMLATASVINLAQSNTGYIPNAGADVTANGDYTFYLSYTTSTVLYLSIRAFKDPGDSVSISNIRVSEAHKVTLELERGGADGVGSATIANTAAWDTISDAFAAGSSAPYFGASSGTGGSDGAGSGKGVRSGLLGWWKIQGPNIDPTDPKLQISKKYGGRMIGGASFEEKAPEAKWLGDDNDGLNDDLRHYNRGMVCTDLINYGGTYSVDTP